MRGSGSLGRVAKVLLVLFGLAAQAACLGSGTIQRSYYVLHGVTLSGTPEETITGQVRVRTLDTASVYEKFQIVVRKSPYELSYSETDVWAVKPNRMVSDVIAEALSQAGQFSSVSRELGDLRPDYILSGDLQAIEVYDSGDVWYAHLAIVLTLARFDTGELLLSYDYDERKHVPGRTFSQSARALSELISTALDTFIEKMKDLKVERAPAVPGRERRVIGPTGEREGEGNDSKSLPADPDDESHPAGDTVFVPIGGDRPIGND